jgi:hypothetical protein
VWVAQAAYFTLPTALVGGTPGQLVLGLRVVDAVSGDKLSLRRAVVRWSVMAVPGMALGAIARNLQPRLDERNKRVSPKITRIHRECADNQDELKRRMHAVMRDEFRLDPLVATATAMMFPLLLFLLTYQLVTLRTIADRLSNTRVVHPRALRR